MNCESKCGARLGDVDCDGASSLRELPMAGPEPTVGQYAPIHTPSRCAAIVEVRDVFERRFPGWDVIVAPVPERHAMEVMVSLRVGAQRWTCQRRLPRELFDADTTLARRLYVAELEVRSVELELAEKGYGVAV